MSWTYLTALLVSTAGMATIDARHQLFLWRAPRRALLVVLVGTAYFLAWDAAGIVTGLFRHLDSRFATGLLLAPHMPVEEIVFLVFLSYLTMVLLMAAGRALGRTQRPGPGTATSAPPRTPGRSGGAEAQGRTDGGRT
ncbi:lycopene cyclase domain-containing protein [Georgenia sp. Z1491]|uniref:lycopene cyclase domain-containing protein n=1 Tax=Georgenia sp. Z1491 TaxID=3416707 RepID=UPI003CF9B1B8